MPDWKRFVAARLQFNGAAAEAENDVVEELAQQFEEAYREALARGLSEEEAAAATRNHVSDWRALTRELRSSRRLAPPPLQRLENFGTVAESSEGLLRSFFGGIARDVALSLRMIRKNPGFTAVAVLTLALGIGANTTIFSWVNAILLTALPGTTEPGRLVEIATLSQTESYLSMSWLDYKDFRAQNTMLEGMLVHDGQPGALTTAHGAERIWAELVSANFFDVLGVKPVMGRMFVASEDETPTAVVVISERLWRNRLDADPDIVGKKIDLNNTPFTVIGVAPREFLSGYTGLATDVWAPVPMETTFIPGPERLSGRGHHWLNAVGRLKPGIRTEQAAAELTAIMGRIDPDRNAATGDVRMGVFPLWKSPNGAQSILGPILMVLMGLVAVVMLITCANVANLMLSRAVARRREFAVRMSVGCSRRRLLRQLTTETFLLVAMASAAALVAQLWTSGLLVRMIPAKGLPVALTTPIDGRMLAFTAALALVSALLFGIAPALQASHTNAATILKTDSAQGGIRHPWMRNVLLGGQVAFTVLLLVVAGLFVRSVHKANAFDPGFRTDHMLLASIDLFSAGYDEAHGRDALERILADGRTLPGVTSASVARRVPLSLGGGSSSTDLHEVEGYQAPKGKQPWTYMNWVGPDYFRTMEITVLRGREFSQSDRRDSPEVLVVNKTFADRYWPGQDPVGKHITFSNKPYEVVGMVANSKFRKLQEPDAPFVYLSTVWNYTPQLVIHARTASDPMALAAALRQRVQRIDAKLPVYSVQTLDEATDSATFQQALSAWLLGAFGVLALVLACVGMYGSMAYSVSRQTRELGVRMALGASRWEILLLILRKVVRITAAGVAVGLVLAFGVGRLVSSLLFQVRPTDPLVFGGVILVLTGLSLLAGYVPALRAARMNPMDALRCE